MMVYFFLSLFAPPLLTIGAGCTESSPLGWKKEFWERAESVK